MTRRFPLKELIAVAVFAFGAGAAQSATTTYADRATFLTAIGGAPTVLDDYQAPGYNAGDLGHSSFLDYYSDAGISNVIHEVAYTMTGGEALHEGIESPNALSRYYYPTKSVLLDFQFTTVGTSSGVYSVGFDHFATPVPVSAPESLWLLVGFGDSTMANYLISGGTDVARSFFGIASDKLIKSIHIGGFGGTKDPAMGTGFDNLVFGGGPTAAPVPLPAAVWLLISGLGGVAAFTRRRKIAVA